MVCATSKSLRSACAYVQSDQSICLSLDYFMTVRLLTEHHLEIQSLKGGCRGSSESTHVKMPHCWKSHALALDCDCYISWSYSSACQWLSSLSLNCSLILVNRGSHMCAHVLLNLLNELRKRDKMRGLSIILSLFRNESNTFNNTRARM